MKKILSMIIYTVLLMLSGCATISNQNPQSPDKLLEQFCPVIQTINMEVLTIPSVNQKIVDTIKVAQPIVNSVCSNGASLTSNNLQALLKDGLPLLMTIASDSAIASTPAGQALQVALPIAEILIPQIISSLPKVK